MTYVLDKDVASSHGHIHHPATRTMLCRKYVTTVLEMKKMGLNIL